MSLKYKRVIAKISGEALCGANPFGIDAKTVDILAAELKEMHDAGVELGIVLGAGNIWRGRIGEGMDRVQADHMGMLATVINALAMQDALLRQGVETVVMTAVPMETFAEYFNFRKARKDLSEGKAVIFAAGTGSPFFTTDSCAALRAAQIEADVYLKATNVDGVYTADPKKDPTAKRFRTLSTHDALQMGLKVADATAFALCQDNDIPIEVFDAHVPGNMLRVCRGEEIGTVVANGETTAFYEN